MPIGISFFFIFTGDMRTASTIALLACIFLAGCKEKDVQSPVIRLNGDGFITVTLNDTFVDPGATATDETDGEIAVSTSGIVDTDMEGNYQISYRASDAAGNTTTAIRIVSVVNAATHFTGLYQADTWQSPDSASFSSHVSTSTTINQRIWLVGIGLFSQAVIYANIIGDSLIVPKQPCTLSGTEHFFSARGVVLGQDPLQFNLDFNDSTSGTLNFGTTTYQKLNP